MVLAKRSDDGIQYGRQNPRWPPKIKQISNFSIRIHKCSIDTDSNVNIIHFVDRAFIYTS